MLKNIQCYESSQVLGFLGVRETYLTEGWTGYHMQEFGLCTSSPSYLTFFSKLTHMHLPLLWL